MTKSWDQNKRKIEVLYREQKKTLKETREIMEERYQFIASYESAPPPDLLPNR